MKSLKGSTLVLWIVCLLFLSGAVMAQRARRDGNHGPKLVVMPVQVKCENSQVAQEAELLTFDYLKEMDFTIITGEKVKKAVRDCGFSLSSYSGRERPSLNEARDRDGKKPVVTQTVLRKDALIEVGDYFKAPYAMGIYYNIYPKKTTMVTKEFVGQRQNGRCKVKILVVDVRSGEIVYQVEQSPEYGVAQKANNIAKIFTATGILTASGLVGSGHKTRNLGWAMIATPFVARLDPGSKEDLMFQATSMGAQDILEDFWACFQDWTK